MREKEALSSDGREKGDYETRYKDGQCQKKIKRDAVYITVLMLLAMLGLLLNFLCFFENILNLTGDRRIVFHKIVYCVGSGLLGGATFGMKYFYRVVARGLWNEDRVYWRFFSPLIAVSLSVIMAAIMIKDVSSSSSLAVTIGFLTGYFSDEAVSKMYDVACVLFLKPDNTVNRDKINELIEVEKKEDNKDAIEKFTQYYDDVEIIINGAKI